jgi:hypothetical protein
MEVTKQLIPESLEKYLYGDNLVATTLENIEKKTKIKRHFIVYGNCERSFKSKI